MKGEDEFRSMTNGISNQDKSGSDDGQQASLQAQARTRTSLQTQASNQTSVQAQTGTLSTRGGGCDMEVGVNVEAGMAGSPGTSSGGQCKREAGCVADPCSRMNMSANTCKRENTYMAAPSSFMEMMNSDSVGEMNGSVGVESPGRDGCSPSMPYGPGDSRFSRMQFYGHPMSMPAHTSQPHHQYHHQQQQYANHPQYQYEHLYERQRAGYQAGPPRLEGSGAGPWSGGSQYLPGGRQAPGTTPPQIPGFQPQPATAAAAYPVDRPIKQEVEDTMSLWAKTQQLSADSLTQVRNAYGTQFPLEVRHFFAQWIEEQAWDDLCENNPDHDQYGLDLLTQLREKIEVQDDLCENNPDHDQYALGLLTQLIEKIEARAQEGDLDWLTKLNLNETAKHFRDWYSSNPMYLVRVVKTCLATERTLVNKETSQPDAMDGQVEQNDQFIFEKIRKTIGLLEERTNSTEQDLRRMQLDQEKFVIDYQKNIKIQNNLQQLKAMPQDHAHLEAIKKLQAEKNAMDQQLLLAGQQLLQQRVDLAQKHRETLGILDGLQKQVVDDELIKWKRSQQLGGNGKAFDHTLIDTIQNWCEALAQLIWENRRQILQVDMLHTQVPIKNPQGAADIQAELNKVVTGLLSSLVTSTFIVEHQPPQVMKKDARFQATVRLLVGGKLHLQMNPPRVKATIISEQQARGLLQSEEGRRTQKCGEILNCEAPMDYHQHSGQLSICFRNMSLKNIKRADRRGADVHCVAEEKFCILFSSDFNVGGNELNFQVWTLSLPVVVTVHGNQECQATATYLWDNQFSEPGRTPFMVPDVVPWQGFASMLSTKFQAMTGRGLSDGNLQYLAHKLLGYNGSQDLGTMTVSWTQFNKENLPGRNFTFWEWFWSIGKLVKEHLKGLWNDGCIHGFIEKNESQELLMARPNGTFLARFSDGTLGGVTIAWVADHEIGGERQVWNLLPFTIKDFAIRGLADRVKDLKSLITLYPDIPKDVSFQKYYTPMPDPSSQPPGAYVKTTLITVIDQPIKNAAPMNFDNPQTPQAYSEQPFSPTNSMAKGDTASLMESLMQEDFQVASPDPSIDATSIDISELNNILQMK